MRNPQQRLLLGVIATATTTLVTLVGVIWWAVSPVTLPGEPHLSPPAVPSQAVRPKLAAERWGVELWRPLVDVPVAVAPLPPPPPVHLFSILSRGGGRVAALDLGGGEGLVYAKPGDSLGAITVVAIDARGVDLTIQGRPQRLELGK